VIVFVCVCVCVCLCLYVCLCVTMLHSIITIYKLNGFHVLHVQCKDNGDIIEILS